MSKNQSEIVPQRLCCIFIFYPIHKYTQQWPPPVANRYRNVGQTLVMKTYIFAIIFKPSDRQSLLYKKKYDNREPQFARIAEVAAAINTNE